MDLRPSGQLRVEDENAIIAIDPDSSHLSGWISINQPDEIRWSIDVEGGDASIEAPAGETPKEADDRMSIAEFISREGCNLEISGILFPLSQWRDLDGVSTTIEFDAADVHPILPDNPGNFYYSTEHHLPAHSRISISGRRGPFFRVAWRFRPDRFAGDTGGEVALDAFLPLRELCVYFPARQVPSEDTARACASRFAAEGDLGAATVDRNCVRFAIRSEVP